MNTDELYRDFQNFCHEKRNNRFKEVEIKLDVVSEDL